MGGLRGLRFLTTRSSKSFHDECEYGWIAQALSLIRLHADISLLLSSSSPRQLQLTPTSTPQPRSRGSTPPQAHYEKQRQQSASEEISLLDASAKEITFATHARHSPEAAIIVLCNALYSKEMSSYIQTFPNLLEKEMLSKVSSFGR